MQIKPPFITCLFVATLVTGCDPAPKASETSNPAGVTNSTTRPEPIDYSYAQKSEFTAEMRRELADINAELDRISAKIENAGEEVKVAAAPKLKVLRDQAAGLSTRIDEAENATESTWESVKTGTRQTFETLKEGFHDSRQWLSEKIAP